MTIKIKVALLTIVTLLSMIILIDTYLSMKSEVGFYPINEFNQCSKYHVVHEKYDCY